MTHEDGETERPDPGPTPTGGRFPGGGSPRAASAGETSTDRTPAGGASGGRGAADLAGRLVDGFTPWAMPVAGDPLGWPGYNDDRAEARRTSGADESVLVGSATVTDASGRPVELVVVASEFGFVGGSMGAAAGERIVGAFDAAREARRPVLTVSRSGGARMQEGMVALVQMARVADAVRRHREAGLVHVAYACSPTTGGVYASLVAEADVLWAEPGATLGFAGPRVVAALTGAPVPPGGHTAESAYASGLVDEVLDADAARRRLQDLAGVLGAAGGRPDVDGADASADASRDASAGSPEDVSRDSPDPRGTPLSHPDAPTRAGANAAPDPGADASADAWAAVQAVRAPGRPSGAAWLERLVEGRVPVAGDRAGGVDPGVLTGVGRTVEHGVAVAYIALDRPSSPSGPTPAGLRAARRLLALAARLRLPILTLVDTTGADASDASERAGIAGEIARVLMALTGHPAPTVSLTVGEGGSGGALAFAATDRALLLDDAVFEVIAPEGAASILYRDPARAPEAAARLRLLASDLVAWGLFDERCASADASARIHAALRDARPGDGRARLDSATATWLHPSS